MILASRGVDGMTLDSKGNIVATAGFKGGPGPMIYYLSLTAGL